jgi:CDP-diacylglycerol pyrophosphatase
MSIRAWVSKIFLVASIILLAAASAHFAVAANRDALRVLVENCLDPATAGGGSKCPAPITGETDSTNEARCKATTDVWAKNSEFVVIRDRKMCGCPRGFEHGLAMPLALISGLESDKAPEGIWQFAWDVASTRIYDPNLIALAVNSRLQRSQDQLHIHIVQLLKGARDNFPQSSVVTVDNLEHVWSVAKTFAQEKGMGDYGVLVVGGPGDKFTVVVADGGWSHSPEKDYTYYQCQ